MVRLYCFLIGLVFGMFQSAYFLGRIKGIDIRQYGSGNSGMTNTLRTLGTKAGLTVLMCDLLKVIVAIILTNALFGNDYPELRYLLKMYTTLGCIVGHNYPFYMHFRGGKGVAVTAGFLCAFKPEYFFICAAAFFVPWLTTHFVSLGSLCMVTAFYVTLLVEGQMGVFTALGMTSSTLVEMYVLGAVITGLCWFQHRSNIGRLLGGCERKTYLGHRNHAALSEEDLRKIREEKNSAPEKSRDAK